MANSSPRLLAGSALVFILAGRAQAEMPAFYSLGERPASELLAAGLLYFHAPRFAGSQATRTVVIPSVTAVLPNGVFADVVNGVGWNASDDKRFEFGPRASVGVGREAVGGLERISNRVVVGGFANWNATESFALQSALRYGSGYDRDGMLVDVGASWEFFKRGYFSADVEASSSFANEAYMRSYYGVPASGRQWSTLGLSVTSPLHERVIASVTVERMWLSSEASSSPFAARHGGTAIQANVSWIFRGID